MDVNEAALAVARIMESPGIEEMEVVVETCAEPDGVKTVINGEDKKLLCPYCRKPFKRFFTMRQHAFKIHGAMHVDLNREKGRIKCGYDEQCDAAFNSMILYRRHLIHVHSVKIQKVKKQFNSLDDFITWKSAEEEETCSRFTKGKEDLVSLNGELCFKKRTFNCNRSGRCIKKGKKGLRKRTSMKIGTYCPARMEISYDEDQKFTLIYFKTHVGHGPLNDVYKTSEKKRAQGALRRLRRQYKALQSEVKTKLELCLEKLCENKFSLDLLKVLSNKLDHIFAAEVEENSKTQIEASASFSEDTGTQDNCDRANSNFEESPSAGRDVFEPLGGCLKEHAYVTKKKVPTLPLPVASPEAKKVKVDMNDKSRNVNNALNPEAIAEAEKILKAVPIRPKIISDIKPKTNNGSIIVLTTTPAYPGVKPNGPLILLNNNGNVLPLRETTVQPSNYILTSCDSTIKKEPTASSILSSCATVQPSKYILTSCGNTIKKEHTASSCDIILKKESVISLISLKNKRKS